MTPITPPRLRARVGVKCACTCRRRNRLDHGRGEPANEETPQMRGFFSAPKRTRTSTRLSRTRPSRRWALDGRVVLRTAASFLSAVENTLDTLDGVDVVKGVVAIRDQGGVQSRVLHCSPPRAVSRRLPLVRPESSFGERLSAIASRRTQQRAAIRSIIHPE